MNSKTWKIAVSFYTLQKVLPKPVKSPEINRVLFENSLPFYTDNLFVGISQMISEI